MSSTPRALVTPPRLGRGARVALVSPSGPLRDAQELEHAVQSAGSMGWEAVPGSHALARDGYFAGTDALRLADFREAVERTDIDGIWCLRGGYGATRLLPDLPVELIAAHPKVLIGYSDITALHALWQRAGLVSYHGPTARAVLTPYSRASFEHVLLGAASASSVGSASLDGTMPDASTLVPGRATGRLVGGNLALVASLCGTPWALDFRDAIVVLEDINEATYRLERMLLQLRLAGAFGGCRGLLLGHFTDCPPESDDGSRSMHDVMMECADALGVPAVLGAPFGHIPDQWTLPLGAVATLDATQRTLDVHS